MAEAAAEAGLPADAVQLVSTTDRDAVGYFLNMPEYIDLAIPRGGEGLIRRVSEEAKMPVIKHYAGNCHVYLDRAADAGLAERLVVNSKCQRLGVCNAAESLVVHGQAAERLLPRIARALAERGIEIRGDQRTRGLVPEAKRATSDDYAAEYLGPVISVKVVDSLDEAVERSILQEGLSELDGEIEVEFLEPPVTLERLEDKLHEGYHVLHYTGHGAYSEGRGQAALYMQADGGDAQIVTDDALIGMLARQRVKPRLVTLFACQSASRSTSAPGSPTRDAYLGLAPKLVGIVNDI